MAHDTPCMTFPVDRLRPAATAAAACAACLLVAACSRGESTLWDLRLPADANRSSSAADVTGYWEGDVAMGGVRLAIEPERITLALRCDSAGRKIAQASAPVVVDHGTPARMTLQKDLAGGNTDCGFRFAKGDQFGYGLRDAATLEVAFAGVSVSRMRKLGDLPTAK